MYGTLFPNAASAPTPQQTTLPGLSAAYGNMPSLPPVTRLPNILRRAATTAISLPARIGRRAPNAGFVLGLGGFVVAGAFFLHAPEAPNPPARQPILAPVPHPQPETQPAPYNGNFAITTPVPPSIPATAFVAPKLRLRIENKASEDLRALQARLRTFGLSTAAPSGQLDEPTRKSLNLVAIITGMDAHDATAADAALQHAETRAADMLWLLGIFPFGDRLPSWLLASLDAGDVDTLSNAFTRHADSGQSIFSVPLKAHGLIVHARLFPSSDTRCFDFSALFERGTLQHHVISRACRDSAARWAMAARK